MEWPELQKIRKEFHNHLCRDVLLIDRHHVATNADTTNQASTQIAFALAKKLGASLGTHVGDQGARKCFEQICARFIKKALNQLPGSRPAKWTVAKLSGSDLEIADFDQYPRLRQFRRLIQEHSQLKATIDRDYIVKPDIVVFRSSAKTAKRSRRMGFIRESNLLSPTSSGSAKLPQLIASISCKWTIRSDRSQNSRSEALNLVRNRKGHTPHIVVVTAEPLPSRLASIALGTGDIDCVYHFALTELRETVNRLNYPDAQDLLKTLIEGKRLRDISDLPLDLSV